MGSWSPQIIRDYDLVTVILIQTLIHPRTGKMGSSIFNAMSLLKFASTTKGSFPSMPPTERLNGEKYFCLLWQCLPLFFFFFSPNNPGFYPLAQTCMYPRQRRWVWRQLSRQYVNTIIPKWVRHLFSLIYHSPGVSHPLVWCVPNGWGVCYIRIQKGTIVEQGIRFCHALFYDVRWQGLFFCSGVRDVHWRVWYSRLICSEV